MHARLSQHCCKKTHLGLAQFSSYIYIIYVQFQKGKFIIKKTSEFGSMCVHNYAAYINMYKYGYMAYMNIYFVYNHYLITMINKYATLIWEIV